MSFWTRPRTTGLSVTEKTPGPSGVTLEMRKIPRRTIVVVHGFTTHTTPRYKELGNVPNRATRRAYARGRGRGFPVPAPTMLPYERPAVGTPQFDEDARVRGARGVEIF